VGQEDSENKADRKNFNLIRSLVIQMQQLLKIILLENNSKKD